MNLKIFRLNYLHYDLGQLPAGAIVEVTLQGNAANVLLLDSANFSNYRSGRGCNYYGGHVTRSPFNIAVPYFGHWHIAIDLGGYRGKVNANVRLI